MFWKVSNIVGLICGVSLALLPWIMIFNREIPTGVYASAAGAWILLGTFAVSVRDGSTRRKDRDEQQN